jgi:nanoRNase/pAp phosphatase (c-di-AMP/oligoRNAs hydrolase)
LTRLPGTAEKRHEQLLGVLSGKRRLLVLTHDNPDPDSIASGWALTRVARRLRSLSVDLAYGGIIGRSENRTLCAVLGVPLKPIERLDLAAYDAVALVDCQPATGNNSLPDDLPPTLVIDHHPLRKQTRQVPFYDVREEYGATATIVSEYLFASEVKLDRHLATALFYAIKSETQNLGREASRSDVRVFLDCFPLVDNQALSRIENPPIPLEYFSMIDSAMDGTRLHGSVVITRLGSVSRPDAVAEFADLMVRLENMRWAVTMGRFGPDLLVSIRTDRPRANAGQMIERICGPEGKAGGHGMMAGGKIAGAAATPESAAEWEERLAQRAVKILKGDPIGVRLLERPSLRSGAPSIHAARP